jgi:hypothetical protein
MTRDTTEPARAAQLVEIIQHTPWLLDLLHAVHLAGPPGAYIAAGSIRDTVWNALTGRASLRPSSDVDVVYHALEEPAGAASEHVKRLHAQLPGVDWEVTNQATIHLWHRQAQGLEVAPHRNVSEGLGTWPETATAVAVRLNASGGLELLAPFGLDDLFELRLCHNPTLVSVDVFWRRVRERRWRERWPELRVVTPER